MAKKLGNDYRLFIHDGASTYTEIAGQQNLSVSRQGQTIDTSTKDNFPYGTAAPGMRSLSIAFELIPNLPDANGYTALETWANSTSPTAKLFQIKTGSTVVFAGSMYCSDFNTSFNQNDAVKATGTLVAASAPTTDVLA